MDKVNITFKNYHLKYKLNDNGRATNFQFLPDSAELEIGWLSIEGDRIPNDISVYDNPIFEYLQKLFPQAYSIAWL